MAAKLVAEEGIQKGLVLSLDEGNEWVIGRDPDACQLLIEDPSASRKHLLCRKTSEGIFLQNLSSTNPVSINDEEVFEPRLLHNGDLVKIGSGLYRFYSEEEAQLLDQEEISQDITNEEPNGNDHQPLPEKAMQISTPQTLRSQPSQEEVKEEIPEEAPAVKDEKHEQGSQNAEEEAEVYETEQKSEEELAQKSEPSISEQEIIPEETAESEAEYSEEEMSKKLDLPESPETNKEEKNQEKPILDAELPEETRLEEQPDGMPAEEMSEGEKATPNPPIDQEKALEEPKHEESKPMSNLETTLEEEKLEEPQTQEIPKEPEEIEADHISIFEEPSDKTMFPEINFDLTETGRWLLKVVGGPNHGAEFTMQPASTYIIGTDPNSCDIVFHDTSVSRQHAKITINDDDTIVLEDLKSRNGTFVDGKPLTGKETVPTNTLITMGTSSFVVYDREGEMQTIISPLLPSIVKVLQEEPKQESLPSAAPQEQAPTTKPEEAVAPAVEIPKKKEHVHDALGAFILIAIITGLFVIIGIGTTTLFKSQPVVTQQLIHPDRDLSQALSAFPNVKYSFNRNTGRLLLVGHVLTASDKNQLLYNLQGLHYIRSIDDSGVIMDEGVWREINQVLSQNPNWKGISIHSPTPGHFVISGYLKTRKQAEQLWDYISSNFPYLDLLEKRVIVEEEVVTSIGNELQTHGFRDISAQMNEGEVVLSGNIQAGKTGEFDKVLTSIKEIPGVRSVKNFVAELAPEQSLINISDKYEITGVSRLGSSTSVVINGRILTRGDILDGMTITSIKPNAVFLEKDGTKYRIDYSK